MEKLKVCPFCGGEPATALKHAINKVEFTVYCQHCYISKTIAVKPKLNEITFDEVKKGMVEAIQTWNIRF